MEVSEGEWSSSSSKLSIYKASRNIKKRDNSLYNALRSIYQDSVFVSEISQLWPQLPLLANLRCGLWYSSNFHSTCYFKSTDGHILQKGGCMIVDSTRRGKRFPDSMSKTIPIWTCVLNRAIAHYRSDFHIDIDNDAAALPQKSEDFVSNGCGEIAREDVSSDWDCSLHLPLWVPQTEKASIEEHLEEWTQRLKVHVIHEWVWAGTPNEGAAWLRLQRLADTLHQILLIPVTGGVMVGMMCGLLEILDQIKQASYSPQRQGFDLLAGIYPTVKAIQAAVTLGTGCSLGPEGPSVDIGKSCANGFSLMMENNRERKIALVAAAGISSGFNAAVAGCFFAIETVLRPLHAENSPPFTIAMIKLASVISSTVSNVLQGTQSAFTVPEYELKSAAVGASGMDRYCEDCKV